MSNVLIPANEMPQGLLAQMKKDVASQVQRLVAAAIGSSQQVMYRDLTASDVNGVHQGQAVLGRLTNPNALTANTVASDQFTNFTLTQTQGCVIFGYVALAVNPLIDEIRFGVGGSATIAAFHLDKLYVDNMKPWGYFDEPLFFNPTEHINVSFLASTNPGANGEAFMFLGYIAENFGFTVAPRSRAAQVGTASVGA